MGNPTKFRTNVDKFMDEDRREVNLKGLCAGNLHDTDITAKGNLFLEFAQYLSFLPRIFCNIRLECDARNWSIYNI